MNPGLFNKRISIQRFTEGVNENGFPIQEWQDVKSVWAMIKTPNDKTSSLEFYEAATTHAKNTLSFVIRYTNTIGIDTDMRILYKEKSFEILSIINDNERNKTLTIIGREVV
ncbi:head-tail adaptor protein [Bacillus methanolicus]|uniref:phage head closure protein n=1 Tax=Bacillus methanolicus TaxID=1471 RepID=UPI00238051AA|nr:phage head closure protein [Bacillus methanolicus]MDE3838657.1 head-tail adaptor protein [Bacillus methanolicus]